MTHHTGHTHTHTFGPQAARARADNDANVERGIGPKTKFTHFMLQAYGALATETAPSGANCLQKWQVELFHSQSLFMRQHHRHRVVVVDASARDINSHHNPANIIMQELLECDRSSE